jgi:2-dehydro-3-deoxyphosphogluconate aldolase/(4S)-4-hydroxy-2-oxoglutarate aldolase
MNTLQRRKAHSPELPDMASHTARIDELCAAARILPVIKIEREADILPLADALAAGGLHTLEITLRSDLGLEAIAQLRKLRPDLRIGAGTVLDESMLVEAVAAGAEFIVTPGGTQALLEAGRESPVPLLPGVSSASEIMLGYNLGYRRFKLFPAELAGGVAALKAFRGPFGNVRFCPTGGLNPGNLQQYMQQPNVMCVGGSWMLDDAWIRGGDWQRVTQASREALQLLA